ncbi:helix-turn-helix domain-containing protein [Flagellimonas taeanensis]|uniref:AraC family transcriptional regulator n=1 Tax=Flavobacteriaceae TaxID=49546 RepID=UPI000E67F252|nr:MULTISPECIES: helix-turn-helix domain-containing protein [Allomuricauda]MDC6384666.1 helix-turn-helix transcriptional regulator [Muricauda sp. SK9]RIV53587.1 helix-turn-helix domain-containing protein [Allomuricauda taeanensis]
MIPILNISEFEKKIRSNEVYSNELGKHLMNNSDIVRTAHKHDFFLCVLFTKGRGTHEIDFNNYDLGPGSVFFLKPGQTHLWKFDSEPEGFIFFHTRDFFEIGFSDTKLEQFPFYFSNENPPNLHINYDNLEQLKIRFAELNSEYYRNLPFKEQKLQSLIRLIYIDLTRLYSSFESHNIIASTTYLNTLRNLETLIQKNYRKEKTVRYYAERLNITTKHLNRITMASIGKSPSELIQERLLLEAKRLLVHSENSLVNISDFLGFKDYAHFSKVFKVKAGSTPTDFRKKYKSSVT